MVNCIENNVRGDFMEKIVLTGVQNKSISVEGNAVTISKGKSLFNATREKVIPITNISGVEVKKPGAMVRGYIQIQIAGQQSGNGAYKVTGGAFDAAQDENSVLLAKKEDYDTALSIKEYILNYSSSPSAAASSAADEIAKYKSLLDSGAITESEFSEKKKQLLGL